MIEQHRLHSINIHLAVLTVRHWPRAALRLLPGMWKNKKASWRNSPIKCCLSGDSAPLSSPDWLASWGEGMMRSTMWTRGTFLRRIDASILLSFLVKALKCTKFVGAKRHYGQNGGKTWRPVGQINISIIPAIPYYPKSISPFHTSETMARTPAGMGWNHFFRWQHFLETWHPLTLMFRLRWLLWQSP